LFAKVGLSGTAHQQAEGSRFGGEVRREPVERICLLVGGVCTSVMGAYHFFLPSMFHWSEYVRGAPQPIWAIFAMNVMLSFLMLWGGLTTIFIALKSDGFGATVRFVTLGMAFFWLLNAAYQAVRPPPFPVRIGFLALAIFLSLLYLVALFASRKIEIK